jgi:hypothetical protein
MRQLARAIGISPQEAPNVEQERLSFVGSVMTSADRGCFFCGHPVHDLHGETFGGVCDGCSFCAVVLVGSA